MSRATTKIAVGMIFLPKADLGAQEICRSIVETEVLRSGYGIYGWRQVPINVDVIGEKANTTRPEIEQIMLSTKADISYEDFERDLYVVRRRIERRVLAEHINDFYICSMSCRSVVYKGMFLAEQLTSFYPDLLMIASFPTSRSITSAIRPTPSRPGASHNRSACWRIMAKSIR